MKKIGRRSIAILLALALLVIPGLAIPASAAVTGVEVLQPLGTAPALTTPGGAVDVSAKVTVDTSDYYMVGIMILQPGPDALYGTADDIIIGQDSELIQLNTGDVVITKLIPIYAGVPAGVYDVLVVADLPSAYTPGVSLGYLEVGAVMVGSLPGAGVGAILVGKPVLIVEAILDKFLPPSGVPVFLADGNAYNLLTDEGKSLVDGVALLTSDGLAIVGGVVNGVRGGVVTYVPMIVNGVLSILADLTGLFSTRVPFAP